MAPSESNSDEGDNTMEKPRDNQSGRYTPAVSDDEIVAIVEAAERSKTSEIADEIGYTLDGAYKRLAALESQGRVASEDWGKMRLWTAVDDEE